MYKDIFCCLILHSQLTVSNKTGTNYSLEHSSIQPRFQITDNERTNSLTGAVCYF